MADEYISKEAFTKGIDETFCKKCEAEKRDYHHCRCGSCEYDYMRCDIESFPAADVAPVIRCKDCDLWNEWDHSGRESLGNFRCSCGYWSVEDGPVFFTAPTDFCSYAEPKEEP